jgi:uncharacterized protein YwlG (UPF0340 family)
MEAAQAAFRGIYPVLQARGIHLAVQCCEHLNRALILERAVAERRGYEIVNVLPQPHAGGSQRRFASGMTCADHTHLKLHVKTPCTLKNARQKNP